jgi:hypothetical protein
MSHNETIGVKLDMSSISIAAILSWEFPQEKLMSKFLCFNLEKSE